jgi:hypothetical protein
MRRPSRPARRVRPRGGALRTRGGSLLLEALFALFLLGVTAMAALALLAHAMRSFAVAEGRGRAVPVAAGWLADPPADSATAPVGPGEIRWEMAPGTGEEGAPPRVRYEDPRGGVWLLPAPARPVPGVPP